MSKLKALFGKPEVSTKYSVNQTSESATTTRTNDDFKQIENNADLNAKMKNLFPVPKDSAFYNEYQILSMAIVRAIEKQPKIIILLDTTGSMQTSIIGCIEALKQITFLIGECVEDVFIVIILYGDYELNGSRPIDKTITVLCDTVN